MSRNLYLAAGKRMFQGIGLIFKLVLAIPIAFGLYNTVMEAPDLSLFERSVWFGLVLPWATFLVVAAISVASRIDDIQDRTWLEGFFLPPILGAIMVCGTGTLAVYGFEYATGIHVLTMAQ